MRNHHPTAFLQLLLLLSSLSLAAGFHLPLPKAPVVSTVTAAARKAPGLRSSSKKRASTELYFWGNNKNNNEEDKQESSSDDDGKVDKVEANDNQGGGGFLGGLLPFFANKEETQVEEPAATATAVQEKPVVSATPAKRPQRVPVPEETDPVKRAEALRAQAERARLEAEKMDAELTLAKISKLERDMAKAVEANDDADTIRSLQAQMDALQAKMRGETPPPVVIPKADKNNGASSTTITTSNSTVATYEVDLGSFSDTDFDELVSTFENSPAFLKKLFARMTEIEYDTVDSINATEVASRMMQMQRMDFSYSNRPAPEFSQQDIQKAIDDNLFRYGSSVVNALNDDIAESVKGNETAKALMALKYNYYVDGIQTGQMTKELIEGDDWLKELVQAVNKTEVDATIEVLYPKCTRKEDEEGNVKIPTMAQVKLLQSEVLPKASFSPRGQPERVQGGYIIRGTSKFDSGDETMDAIDQELARNPNLQEKMTVLLIKDFTLLAEAESNFEMVNPDNQPPILFVMGPDIVPERKRVALSITSAFGIATSWYLSVYPFLLNPAILKRTEEQLELADSSMAYDLSWLTELSLPLFVTFIGIQLAHEAGHKIMGAVNGVETTFPTFVPSLITGVTSTVTQYKEPPKNKEAMFDVAIAGPLAGIVASLAALVVGAQLTLTSDPNLLPALPLDILRQSTLGGGIIDAILGSGALSVPYGAETSQAVSAMTVSLHPVAVAGYIGLILNGLALLPAGTTDGGRVALALFGRGSKPFIGNIMLSTIFLIGVLGSDLFLFYFSFLIAFQTGNEIPARNEVDDISFSRVLVATAGSVLALLTLIPFQ